MKNLGLFCCLVFFSLTLFASFPVEVQSLTSEYDPINFKIDPWGF